MTRWSLFLQTLSLLLHHFLGLYWLLIFRERLAPNQIVGLAIVLPGLITLGAMT